MTYAILDTTLIHDGWSKFRTARVRRVDGTVLVRELEEHGHAVAVLPYDPQRRTALLVRQFRAAVRYAGGPDALTEAPAGLLDGEDPEACARREAMEEVGVRLGRLEPAGRIWASPGISTELMHLYLAPFGRADRTEAGGGLAEEHEDITVLEIPLDELARRAEDGSLDDLKTLALVQTLRLRHPGLFAPLGEEGSGTLGEPDQERRMSST
jgi:nudix-type nucleoside diphosphatase (YffH/AdpP family)